MSDDDIKPIGKPRSYDELHPGRFLKAGELKGKKWTLTVESFDLREIDGETKGTIAFKETPKLFTVNVINKKCLRAMFGDDPQTVVGKRVTIYPDKVKEAGSMQGDPCIRIYGSPDIAHAIDVVIHLRKRRPYTMTMHKDTGSKTEARGTEP